MKKKKIVCLIPARSGSTRIPNKNIILLNKKPLISYSLNSALKSRKIKKVYVSTNSKKIIKTLKKFKNKKLVITNRSKKSETKFAQTELLLNEFCKRFEFDILVLLQLTNIFISSKTLDMAINKFIKSKADSLISVVNFPNFIWKTKNKFIEPFNYNPLNRPRSQDLKNFFLENGSFYIFTRKGYLNYKNRIHGNTTYFQMPKKSYFDIDTFEDLNLVKKLIS